MEKGGGAAPTGCYKCGRPGHWSRDCPAAAAAGSTGDTAVGGGYNKRPIPLAQSKPKPKKAPRSRPKLTPELLLSQDGFGHILRYFPRGFRFRGRGHEVDDLGHLLGMYKEWHSKLIPYYPFDQFVHKAEQVCATKRVKLCIRQLQEKVANGVDTTKLYEPQVPEDIPSHEKDTVELEQPNMFPEDNIFEDLAKDDEEMLHEVLEKNTEETSHVVHDENVVIGDPAEEPVNKQTDDATTRHNVVIVDPVEEQVNKSTDDATTRRTSTQLSEEQRARMEANKRRALERAAARARSSNIS